MTGGKRRVNGRTGPTVPTPGKGTPGPEDPEPRREPAPGPEPRPHPRASGRHRGHGPHPGSCGERACQVPPPPVEGRGGLPTPTPAWTPTQHESNASHDQTLPDAQASPKSASWPRRGSAKQPRHGETAPKRQGGTGAGLQGPSGVYRRPPQRRTRHWSHKADREPRGREPWGQVRDDSFGRTEHKRQLVNSTEKTHVQRRLGYRSQLVLSPCHPESLRARPHGPHSAGVGVAGGAFLVCHHGKSTDGVGAEHRRRAREHAAHGGSGRTAAAASGGLRVWPHPAQAPGAT